MLTEFQLDKCFSVSLVFMSRITILLSACCALVEYISCSTLSARLLFDLTSSPTWMCPGEGGGSKRASCCFSIRVYQWSSIPPQNVFFPNLGEGRSGSRAFSSTQGSSPLPIPFSDPWRSWERLPSRLSLVEFWGKIEVNEVFPFSVLFWSLLNKPQKIIRQLYEIFIEGTKESQKSGFVCFLY